MAATIRTLFLIILTIFSFQNSNGFCLTDNLLDQNPADTTSDTEETIRIGYGDKGFELSTSDGNYKLQIQSRVQIRYAYPFDTDPVTYSDFQRKETQTFKVNRARLKIGGNAFKPWFKFFWEYELASGNLLDFRLMLEKFEFLRLKAGQWKIHYNRERIISSGQQQTLDRSILTRPFTIDRQQGISIYGRLKDDGIVDFNYWFDVLTGTGRGSSSNDDDNLMLMSRLQWNCFGEELDFSGSDLEYHETPAGLIALAGVTNQSPYTRFSQSGGGQLEGFEDGEPGQYRVNQFLVETALMFKGFSWQQEFHWKEIDDKKNLEITTLLGNYVQFGYFFHYLLDEIPEQLELAFRYAVYDPDRNVPDDKRNEYSLDMNWFFKGHLNKLTAEISYLNLQRSLNDIVDGFRFRLQWDVSI